MEWLLVLGVVWAFYWAYIKFSLGPRGINQLIRPPAVIPSPLPSPDADISSIRSMFPDKGRRLDDHAIRVLYARALKYIELHRGNLFPPTSRPGLNKFVASLESQLTLTGQIVATQRDIQGNKNGSAIA